MGSRPADTEPGPAPIGLGEPARVKHLISRAEAAFERDDYAAALLDLRRILADHPDFADVRNRTGFCRAMLGDAEGALQEFAHAIRLNPEYTEAHLNRALVLNDLTRFDEAREAFERAGELDVRKADPIPGELGNRIALGHADLGDLYVDAGRPSDAAEEYTKALEIRPGFVDIRSRLARALLAVGDAKGAVEELTEVLKQRPTYLEARLHLGTALRRMGRTRDAVSEWRRCLELEPGNQRAQAFLVSALGTQDDVNGSAPHQEAEAT